MLSILQPLQSAVLIRHFLSYKIWLLYLAHFTQTTKKGSFCILPGDLPHSLFLSYHLTTGPLYGFVIQFLAWHVDLTSDASSSQPLIMWNFLVRHAQTNKASHYWHFFIFLIETSNQLPLRQCLAMKGFLIYVPNNHHTIHNLSVQKYFHSCVNIHTTARIVQFLQLLCIWCQAWSKVSRATGVLYVTSTIRLVKVKLDRKNALTEI